jgi:hypothetical protein
VSVEVVIGRLLISLGLLGVAGVVYASWNKPAGLIVGCAVLVMLGLAFIGGAESGD